MSPIFTQFTSLREIWKTSRQAQGGINAVKGFDFQYVLFLKKLANSVNNKHIISTEEISDITELSANKLIITQAKYSLDSKSITSALNELWSIFLLMDKNFPELKQNVEFKVLGDRQILRNAQEVVQRWNPEKGFDVIESKSLLIDFKSKVFLGLESDPLLSLAQDLVRQFGFENPFDKINSWLGDIYSSIPKGTLENVSTQIKLDIEAKREAIHRSKQGFHLWTEKDISPSEIIRENDSNKAVLVGQIPDRSHLKEGRFAQRRIYQQIYEEFDAWQKDAREKARGRIPVFWLSGHSGCGKSIALLHLLAELKKQDPNTTIAWFGSRVKTMDKFVPWMFQFLKADSSVFLAFDDPYSFDNQQAFSDGLEDLKVVLENAIDDCPQQSMPVILCCGPDEQFRWFQQDRVDDVAIHNLRLQEETVDDINELKAWYEQRTGRQIRGNLEHEQKNGRQLLVQTLFSWQTNESLENFSQRFRNRLEHEGWKNSGKTAFELVSEMLAVNRLYALYPTDAYEQLCDADPYLGQAMDHLLEVDKHFSLSPSENGIRFTHPHLADVLYQEWYKDQNCGRFRKKHLTEWIDKADEIGQSIKQQLEPFWVLSRISNKQTNHKAADRLNLIQQELKELLPVYYNRMVKQASFATLPVWTDLNVNLDLNLSPCPLKLIIEKLDISQVNQPGFRLACHKLIQHHHQLNQDELSQLSMVLCLDQQWPGWVAVTLDYIKHFGLVEITDIVINYVDTRAETRGALAIVHRCLLTQQGEEQPSETIKIIQAWLLAINVGHSAWPAIFTNLYDLTQVSHEVKAKAKRFLVTCYSHSSWSFVWERLWASDYDIENISSLAMKRLQKNLTEPGWTYLWERLWKENKQCSVVDKLKLRKLALQWLEKTPGHDSWFFVWEPLWEEAEEVADKAKLRNVTLQWLEKVLEHISWSNVWGKLWKVAGVNVADKAKLQNLALHWLDQLPEHNSWQYVWEPLWKEVRKEVADNRELRNITLQWLERVPLHNSWLYVWRLLWEENGKEVADNRELRNIALQWLDQVPEHNGWREVWEPLWKEAGEEVADKVKLRNLALHWLDQVPEHNSWCEVWVPLWKEAGEEVADKMKLRNLAFHWLDQVSEHNSWQQVWRLLWKEAGEEVADKMKLRNLAFHWLKQVPEHNGWREVWEPLWKEAGEEVANKVKLRNLALHWLDQVPENNGWGLVWEQLWKEDGEEVVDKVELRNLALHWLDQVPENNSWGLVWELLCKENGEETVCNEALSKLALDWLAQVPEHIKWHLVWVLLWKKNVGKVLDKEKLLNLVVQWLNKTLVKPINWQNAWERICEEGGRQVADRHKLQKLLMQWLEQAPPNHGSWYYAWNFFWKEGGQEIADKHKLKNLLMQWLEQAPPNHGGWQYAWNFLWKENGNEVVDKENLRNLALQWLVQVPSNHGGWKYVWESLWKEKENKAVDKENLRNLALQWLTQAPSNHGSWQYIWDFLWKEKGNEAVDKEKLRNLALQWLEKVPEHKSWKYIWKQLWKEDGQQVADKHKLQNLLISIDKEKLRNLALHWLEKVPDNVGWHYVWGQLWKETGEEAICKEKLRSIAMHWLKQTPPSENSWDKVWCRLWDKSTIEKECLADISKQLLTEQTSKNINEIKLRLSNFETSE